MIYTHKKQITRPGSLFKWEAWRILLLQLYEQSLRMQTFSKGNDTKVDFFDIFVFDNVKSGLKIIHYQPNKMGFKVKVLPTLLSTFAFPQRCFITISCHRVILFHNLFFNPAVIVLHEVDALNRCCQSLAIYSRTSVFLNFGLCYYVTNISGIELYNIIKIIPP